MPSAAPLTARLLSWSQSLSASQVGLLGSCNCPAFQHLLHMWAYACCCLHMPQQRKLAHDCNPPSSSALLLSVVTATCLCVQTAAQSQPLRMRCMSGSSGTTTRGSWPASQQQLSRPQQQQQGPVRSQQVPAAQQQPSCSGKGGRGCCTLTAQQTLRCVGATGCMAEQLSLSAFMPRICWQLCHRLFGHSASLLCMLKAASCCAHTLPWC